MNINWFWQRKQDKKQSEPVDKWTEHIKSERKKLRKKLTVRIGGKPRTHDMDDEMYETVDKMLRSQDRADIEIARTIIYDSNISNKHLDKLVTEHTTLLLYGPNDYGAGIKNSFITASFSAVSGAWNASNVSSNSGI